MKPPCLVSPLKQHYVPLMVHTSSRAPSSLTVTLPGCTTNSGMVSLAVTLKNNGQVQINQNIKCFCELGQPSVQHRYIYFLRCPVWLLAQSRLLVFSGWMSSFTIYLLSLFIHTHFILLHSVCFLSLFFFFWGGGGGGALCLLLQSTDGHLSQPSNALSLCHAITWLFSSML